MALGFLQSERGDLVGSFGPDMGLGIMVVHHDETKMAASNSPAGMRTAQSRNWQGRAIAIKAFRKVSVGLYALGPTGADQSITR